MNNPADVKQRNIRFLYLDTAAWGIALGIGQTFLAIYVLRLGGTDGQVGLLAALPALVYMLWFIPAGQMVESRSDIKKAGVSGVVLFRMQYLLFALVPFLPAPYQVPSILAIVMLAGLPLCVANVALSSVIAEAVPAADRPRVISNRAIITALGVSASAFLGGKFLDLLPLPVNYQILFLVAFAFSMASAYFLSRLTVAPHVPAATFSLRPRLFVRHFADIWTTVRGDRSFARFTLAAFTMHWAMVFGWPLFSLWWVNGLKVSEGLIGLITTVNTLIQVALNRVWARVAERRGNRTLLLAGYAGITPIPVMTAFAPFPEFLLIPESIGGMSLPALNNGMFNGLLDVSPVERRPSHIAFYSAAVNVPMFLAPILATSIVAPLIGVQYALALATPMRAAALVIVYFLVRDVPALGKQDHSNNRGF
jgi:MFS family permease